MLPSPDTSRKDAALKEEAIAEIPTCKPAFEKPRALDSRCLSLDRSTAPDAFGRWPSVLFKLLSARCRISSPSPVPAKNWNLPTE